MSLERILNTDHFSTVVAKANTCIDTVNAMAGINLIYVENPVEGQILQYDATEEKWVNQTNLNMPGNVTVPTGSKLGLDGATGQVYFKYLPGTTPPSIGVFIGNTQIGVMDSTGYSIPS